MKYRDCTISFDLKPIPSRAHDWEWIHPDYDGAPDSTTSHMCGTAGSERECYEQIDELYAEMGVMA